MASLQSGTVLGERFELIGELGSGGVAVVYLAYDRLRDERIALKVLHPHLSGDRITRARLRREVQAAGRIRHPNALVAYELHELDGQLALSMPLHTGSTLGDAVAARGPLDGARLQAIAEQLAGALQASHRVGVIHRDVTPNNVLVDEQGTACLSDFGLARLDGQRTATATTAMGTWGYAPPELFEGKRVDPRADLYSLGAVLYFAATGRSPFDAANPAAILQRQLAGNFQPLAEARPDVPRPLCAVIDALLATSPDDRPASVGAALDALQHRAAPPPKRAPAPPPAPEPLPTAAPPGAPRSHLPEGAWRVEVSERSRHRSRRRELRKLARNRREGRLDAHLRDAFTAVGVEVRRGLGLPIGATPEQELARAVARIADLPPEALEVAPAMLERHFELVRGVSEDAAQRLVNSATGAGFRARMSRTDTPPASDLGANVFVDLVMFVVAAILALFSPGVAQRMRERRDGTHQLPLAYDHDLRAALARGYTHLLAAPAPRTPRATHTTATPSATAAPSATPAPAPSAKPARNPLHERAIDAIEGLNVALRDEAARLPAPVLDDLRRTSSALRDRANALAERIATLDAELANSVDADEQAAAARVEARIERLRTLERAGALQDASELPKLERALEAHQRAAESAQDLEDAHTLAIAHLLELTATATAARRDLLADAGAISAPLVVERLQREASAASSALREVGSMSPKAQGAAAGSRQRT